MGMVGKILENIRKKAGKIRETVFHFFQGGKALFKNKKSMLLIGIGSAACLLLIGLLSLILIMNNGRKNKAKAALELAESFKPLPIEADELFWPEEPDFVPRVQLDRKPKKAWTEADALPYWIDPNKSFERKWRERIFSVIDDMMEKVP